MTGVSGKYFCTCCKVSSLAGDRHRQTHIEYHPNFSTCAVKASTHTYKVSSKFSICPDKLNNIIYRHKRFHSWRSPKRSSSKPSILLFTRWPQCSEQLLLRDQGLGSSTDKLGLPWWLRGKNLPACKAGELGSIPGSGRSPGEGKGNPLHYSCLENPMGRGAWRATESDTTERLNNNNADKVMQKFQRQLVPVTSIFFPQSSLIK